MKLASDPLRAGKEADELGQQLARMPRNRSAELLSAAASWIQAAAELELNRPEQARALSEAALARVTSLAPADPLRAELLLAHGGAESALGHVQQTLSDYQAAFRIFGEAHVPRGQAVALQRIAATYGDARDRANTIKYTNQSLEYYSADPMLRLSGYNNLATAYTGLGQYDLAATNFRRALIAARQIDSPLLQVKILRNLAASLLSAHRRREAQATLDEALRIARTGPAAAWRPALTGVAAALALDRHDLDVAAAEIQLAFKQAKTSSAALPMANLHEVAYDIYRARGDAPRALRHLEAFKALDDRDSALAASNNAALMSARFDFANQDLKITRLRQAQAEREAVLARTRVRYHAIFTSGLLAAAGIITTLLAIGFVSISRSRNQVRAANITLQGTNAQLEKALAAKSEFLATTSHEIRTPLNGILGMTQVLLADRGVDPKLHDRVQLIHGAGETMRALVDDILDMAKMESGELRIYAEEMDLRRLLQDAGTVWAGQAQTKGIDLIVDLERCPVGIIADQVRLRQIVFNLMSNAIKFTDRGQVRMTARTEQAEAGERLLIEISDSGIGIPSDRLNDIFEAFHQVDGGVTRRHGGTGLGLAICRNLACAMGGDVEVRSTVGTGSTFTTNLPLVRADPPAAAAGPKRAVSGLAEVRMLLIEPNPLSQGILRALLAPHVAALHVVTDRAGATDMLAGGGVDHVLIDGAAFGLDVAAATQFLGSNTTRTTMLWPSPDEAVTARLRESGAHDVVAKPISAPDLLARLRMSYAPSADDRDLAA